MERINVGLATFTVLAAGASRYVLCRVLNVEGPSRNSWPRIPEKVLFVGPALSSF